MFCYILAQLRLTLHCYDNSGYCYHNKFFVVVSAAQASEVLRSENRSKLCPYISVKTNILALNGCPLHQTVFGLAISANPTIVRHKMTEIVRAQ